ncbi:MAG: hypothetical protein GVY26_05325 [Bacteroidetes bacterium]|jgi:hypothetical protein|nr:hypothetical protein [Bacteroidota bacterium]
MKVKSNWSYEEFSAFAMLYAATIDSHIAPEEEALIKQRLGEADYERVKSVFEQCSDHECIETILSYHDKYMSDEAGRQRILDDFRQVFTADHRYSPMEQEMMHIFKQLL